MVAAMRTDRFAKNHLHSLDALRGIAALGIVAGHFGWNNSLVDTAFRSNAHLFVDFFFVLSGFVIALNYGERIRDGAGLARFAWLRFWRLYPLHLAVLLVFALPEAAKWYGALRTGGAAAVAARGALATLASNLVLLQALRPAAFNVPSWSISTEFWAYLVFAATALASRRRFVWLAPPIVLATGWLLLRSGDGFVHANDWLAFARCLFGFFLGVAVYGIHARVTIPLALSRPAAAAVCAAPIALMAVFLAINTTDAFGIVVPLISGVLVLVLAAAPANAVRDALSTPPMIWLGAVSYSIYMVHWALVLLIVRLAGLALHVKAGAHALLPVPTWAGNLLSLAAIALTLGVAHLTYRWIEAPWRTWSRTFWPAPRRPPVPSGAAP
jgi:peptidoglycan/LPS O-acetylase OafA/YrhL